jgi:hypothetical protein
MLSSQLSALLLAAVASAHTIITYPGWRGNNLITNDEFPYGMQWMYPCGGMNTTNNRTFWSTEGGAVAFQPGWFRGHESAIIYINLGFGTDGPDNGPKNMSNPMAGPIHLVGPSNGPYPGSICLPQVPLPKNATVKAGDKATIQVVELAVHGASLFSCVDIEFAEPGDPRIALVNDTNCENSTEFGFGNVYTTITEPPLEGPHADQNSAADLSLARLSWAGWTPLIAGALWMML